MTVNIVTRPYCPYCKKAVDLLRKMGVDFDEIEIETREEQIAWKEQSGHQTFPQIWVNSTHVGGFDDLQKTIDSRAFYALLNPGSAG